MIEIERQQRVAIYIRVSSEEQMSKFGPEVQRETLMAFIKSRGKMENGEDKLVFAGDKYLFEESIPGTTSMEERPIFNKLCELIRNTTPENRPFDIVAVYKIDRFARSLKVLLDITVFLKNNDVQFISASESIDTSTPFGRAMLSIMGVLAELERDNIEERTQKGRKIAALAGVLTRVRFGYIKDRNKVPIPIEEEAKVVRLIFHLFVHERMTIQSIATHLTDQGYDSPEISAIKNHKIKANVLRKSNPDNFWRAETVRDILTDETQIGVLYAQKTQDGQALPKDKWIRADYEPPANIEKATFFLAQELLIKNKLYTQSTVRAGKDEHVYILTGLLRCGNCERTFGQAYSWGGERKKKVRQSGEISYRYYYRCGHKNTRKSTNICNVTPLPADQIEKIVIENLLWLLKNPEPVIEYARKLDSSKEEMKYLKKERQQLEKLMNTLPEKKQREYRAYVAKIITMEQYEIASKDYDQKISDNKEKIIKLDSRINSHILDKDYTRVFKEFSKRYEKSHFGLENNRLELLNLCHSLIDYIQIQTRPHNPDQDKKLSGRRKTSVMSGKLNNYTQQIPYKIDIHFKLPDELMNEIISRFGVQSIDM